MLWTEEENAARANVAGDQSDRKFFLNVVHAAKPQRQAQCSARIFAMLGVNADSMRRDANKLAGFGVAEQGLDAECGDARRNRGLRGYCSSRDEVCADLGNRIDVNGIKNPSEA